MWRRFCVAPLHICMATPKPSLRWSHRAYLPPIPHLYLSYSMPSLKTFLNQSDRIVSQPDYRDVPYPDFMELRHTMALERWATPWLYRSMPDHGFTVWCHDLGLMPFNLFTLNTIMWRRGLRRKFLYTHVSTSNANSQEILNSSVNIWMHSYFTRRLS